MPGSGSTEGKKISKTKKAAVRRAKCYLSVSSCPALPLLLIPLCALLVMRQSCGSLWNLIRISRKQARWAICLQPAFTITSLLQPSILFSFPQLYFSLTSAIPLPSLPLSSCNFTSRIHTDSFPPVFSIHADPTTALAFYLFVSCSSKVIRCHWSPQVCKNYMCANRMLLHGGLATCCQK